MEPEAPANRRIEGKRMKTAVAYFRTSSATNSGEGKDSERRQREAVTAYAKRNGIEVVREYYDAAVSGADPIDSREGFTSMLAYMAGNGAKIILIENASRFARDVIVQLTGHEKLKALGFDLIPVDAPDYFIEDTPTAKLIRTVLGGIAEFEKAELVAKLKGARDRKSKELGHRVEGRKGLKETRPDMVREARRLRRKNPHTGKRRSLRTIAAELAAMGYSRPDGSLYSAATIKNVTS